MRLRIGPVGLQIRGKSVQLGGHPIEFGCGFFAFYRNCVQLDRHRIEFGCGNIALCRNDIELVLQTIHPPAQPPLHPIDLFREHLMALDDKVQFVLESFSLNPQLMTEFLLYVVFERRNHVRQPISLRICHGRSHFTESVWTIFSWSAGVRYGCMGRLKIRAAVSSETGKAPGA